MPRATLHPKPMTARITLEDIADCRYMADTCHAIATRFDGMASRWRSMGDAHEAGACKDAASLHHAQAVRWEWEANNMQETIA